MSRYRVLRNTQTGAVILGRARWCASFWCHFKGLMFVPRLPSDAGLLFVTRSEGRSHTAIHMFFMRFEIAVVWLDAAGRVVDKALAKRWRPMVAPRSPAMYYIEANPDLLDRVQIGDQLQFDEAV